MPVDQNQQGGRRPHYHRGRRGPDRRGTDRRAAQSPEPSTRASEQVDVEQIMRDIRARIAQRHGIELSTQQIQELAARRLEAILDPRTVNPSLMQQLRRGAAAAPEVAAPATDPGYAFEATTLYDSHRGVLRFIRRLLNPLLKLFFNPTPLVQALHTQARLNRDAAAREAERDRLQMEWNALHYEIVQRLVTEVSRVSVEMQALGLRVESLAARVDFNDRRVRSMESGAAPAPHRPQSRPAEPTPVAAPPTSVETSGPETSAVESGGELSRRRRRRRRGRRGGAAPETSAPTVVVGGSEGLAGPDTADLNDSDTDEGDVEDLGAPPAEEAASGVAPDAMTPAAAPSTIPEAAPPPPEQQSASPSEQSASPSEQLAPPPEQLAPPRDEPAPPPEPDPGPPDR